MTTADKKTRMLFLLYGSIRDITCNSTSDTNDISQTNVKLNMHCSSENIRFKLQSQKKINKNVQ